VQRSPSVGGAVFPNEPERTVYNNALLERDLALGFRDLGRLLEYVPWDRALHSPTAGLREKAAVASRSNERSDVQGATRPTPGGDDRSGRWVSHKPSSVRGG
jgi:hypothetical protein